MNPKTVKYTMLLVLWGLLSCKKQESDSDLPFSQTCDFSDSDVETVTRLTGSLIYTNNIMDIPPSALPPNAEHAFLIRSAGRLQMVVCNMPSDFEMEVGESRNITFSAVL
ncbi:hypothetical protein SAMN05444682_10854 [Parapedobacter indicus]|uniref:Uncharacterized protein n=1 Tax=Parapedobacter indicus TaxID=1477437 RepID=A0A1I3PJA9_9SPHI|nr:hypothetical protein CLV26_10854 [Parapedobacter indicus]SFJ21116.1 hypothetical protein SAMN05444682_10854 [Parapedobacter indicus]